MWTPRQIALKENAQRLQHAYAHVLNTHQTRQRSQKHYEQWQTAVQHYHELYQLLALPINNRTYYKNHPEGIQLALDFLEVDPMYMYSGHTKELFWRFSKQWVLTSVQLEQLERAALSYLYQPIRRDFWSMGAAMAVLASDNFWQTVEKLLKDDHKLVAFRAKYLWQYRLGADKGGMLRHEFYQLLRKSSKPD